MSINYQQAFVIAAAICATSSLAQADATKGSIVWTGGFVSGIGVGTAKPSGNKSIDKMHAIRAAEVLAQRSLLETIKGVKIDSVTTVENMVLVEDRINSRVQGMVKGAEVYESKVEWDDGLPVATVEMRVCLGAEMNGCKGPGLASALNLEQMKIPAYVPAETLTLNVPSSPAREAASAPKEAAPAAKDAAPAVKETAPAVKDAAPAAKEAAPAVREAAPAAGREGRTNKDIASYDTSRKVTGLVLNLEGQFFEREMLPIIATKADGRLTTVYCVKNVKPSVVRTYGAVRYADSIDQVSKIAELGDNLLILPVAEVTKENMVLITPENAGILRQTIMNGNDYLNDAKVAISSR